jgi:hypothetical protein
MGYFIIAPPVALAIVRFLPQKAIDFLYFFPQYVFPLGHAFRRLATPSPDAAPIGYWADGLLWLLVAAGFGLGYQGHGRRVTLVAAVLTVLAVTGIIHLALPALGFKFYLDGPR